MAKAQEQIDYLRGALAVEAERFKKAEREYIEADHRTGLMVGDTRLVDKPYGKQLWRGLPPFARTRVLEDAVQFLTRHHESDA